MMNIVNVRALTAGVLLALSTGGAQAAINNGLGAGSSVPPIGPGELFLMVWDQAGLQSFSLDLGYTLETIKANPLASQTWDLGSTFQTFAATNPGNTLLYNIEAANTYGGKGTQANPNLNYGVGATGLAGVDLSGANNRSSNVVPTWAANIGSNAVALNQAAIPYNGGVYNTTTGGNYAANLAEITTDPSAKAYYENLYGGTSSLNIPWDETGVAGVDSLSLYFIGLNPGSTWNATTGGYRTQVVDVGQGSYQFSLNLAANTLTWGAPAPVPVPAAVWLMLSALGSLGVIGRRQGKTA